MDDIIRKEIIFDADDAENTVTIKRKNIVQLAVLERPLSYENISGIRNLDLPTVKKA